MIDRLVLQRTPSNTLIPIDVTTDDLISQLPIGVAREFLVKDPVMNPLMHRKFHKMLKIAFDNLPDSEIPTYEVFRKNLMLKIGHAQPISHPGLSKEYLVASSISPSVIGQDKMRWIFRSSFDKIIREYGEIVPNDFLKTFY